MSPSRLRARRSTSGVAALLLVAASAVAGCGQAPTPEVAPSASGAPSPTASIPGLDEADAAAYQRWQAAGLTDYRFSVDVQCFCPVAKPVVVTVRDGQVTSARPEPLEFWSDVVVPVPDLFQLVADTRDTADVVEVAYDAELGYPKTISVDRVQAAIDDEVAYVVTHFAPLG
jgi:hypothetical protein